MHTVFLYLCTGMFSSKFLLDSMLIQDRCIRIEYWSQRENGNGSSRQPSRNSTNRVHPRIYRLALLCLHGVVIQRGLDVLLQQIDVRLNTPFSFENLY
jgi:hypothetical protein